MPATLSNSLLTFSLATVLGHNLSTCLSCWGRAQSTDPCPFSHFKAFLWRFITLQNDLRVLISTCRVHEGPFLPILYPHPTHNWVSHSLCFHIAPGLRINFLTAQGRYFLCYIGILSYLNCLWKCFLVCLGRSLLGVSLRLACSSLPTLQAS